MGNKRNSALTADAVITKKEVYHALARLVAFVHTGIVLFFSLGWLLPWDVVHWIVIGGGLMMQMSWWFLNDNCPLTLLERWLTHSGAYEYVAPSADEQFFVSGLLSRFFNRPVSDRAGNIIVYIVLYSSMGICSGKLMVR